MPSPGSITTQRRPADSVAVTLRAYPYPFRSILAICSDLDGTPDAYAYWQITEFLNTTKATAMGPGLGLEVGNSIFFDMPAGQFSYWNADAAGREMVRGLIRSGYIDCLHSFGDLATGRSHAGKALEELARHDCWLEVWTDHSRAATNFGPDIMKGKGDLPGSDAYHADLTCQYGIRYIWRGRVTSVVGQQVPVSFAGIARWRHPFASAKTVAKEVAKHLLARCGNRKYAMHAANAVIRCDLLRDGQSIIEFMRSNPHWRGVGDGATAVGLAEVLTTRFLDRLVLREAVCVLYTHLGKRSGRPTPFDRRTVWALRHLAERYRAGRIHVLTTQRLLRYLTVRDALRFDASLQDGCLRIEILPDAEIPGRPSALTGDDLGGLTFYVPDAPRYEVRLGGARLQDVRLNPPDHTGRRSVTVPMRRLEFPDTLRPRRGGLVALSNV